MKRTDLEKNTGLKISSRMKQAGAPGRYGAGSGDTGVSRREQRKLDQARGLVPFAVKLDAELVKQIHKLAQDRGVPLTEMVSELLRKGLSGGCT